MCLQWVLDEATAVDINECGRQRVLRVIFIWVPAPEELGSGQSNENKKKPTSKLEMGKG